MCVAQAEYTVDWMVDGNDGLIAARNKTIRTGLMPLAPERRGTEILEARSETEDHPLILKHFN